MLVGGTKQYGKIARVPGLLHVSTQFVHFCFLPLFPTGSFVVRAGSEVSDGFFGGTFQGKSVPLHLGSVLAGYGRWWFGLPMVVMLVASWIAVNDFLLAAEAARWLRPLCLIGGLVLLALVVSSMIVPGKAGYQFQVVVHIVSAVAGFIYLAMVEQQPRLADLRPAVNTPVPPLLIANVCLLMCGLFRGLDYADTDEARKFAQKLGVELLPVEGDDWELAE